MITSGVAIGSEGVAVGSEDVGNEDVAIGNEDVGNEDVAAGKGVLDGVAVAASAGVSVSSDVGDAVGTAVAVFVGAAVIVGVSMGGTAVTAGSWVAVAGIGELVGADVSVARTTAANGKLPPSANISRPPPQKNQPAPAKAISSTAINNHLNVPLRRLGETAVTVGGGAGSGDSAMTTAAGIGGSSRFWVWRGGAAGGVIGPAAVRVG